MSEMVNLVRREVVETARTVVVKVGTNVLSRDDDTLNVDRICSLGEQIDRICASGRRVVVVSSGAVGAGIGRLGLKSRPKDLRHLQAAAATGQADLIRVYNDAFHPHGLIAAQLLVTANDFKQRSRYLNVRNTLYTLFEYNAVPIINENDTVSIAEIKFGDNDHLAAMVTNLLDASLLVILSVVEGLYDGDPNSPDAKVVHLVEQWSDDLKRLAIPGRSSRGSGGMQSKLEAVRTTTSVGENVIIADGRRENILDEIMQGKEIGTLFLASGASVPAWKRWIGYTVAPKGRFTLDSGAQTAILKKGRSLLAIGVQQVEGEFSQGEVVALCDSEGQEIARGLTNYNSHDARQISGHRTEEIPSILGSLPYEEVIHRDNLVIRSS